MVVLDVAILAQNPGVDTSGERTPASNDRRCLPTQSMVLQAGGVDNAVLHSTPRQEAERGQGVFDANVSIVKGDTFYSYRRFQPHTRPSLHDLPTLAFTEGGSRIPSDLPLLKNRQGLKHANAMLRNYNTAESTMIRRSSILNR